MADPGFSTLDDANLVGVPILLMVGWGANLWYGYSSAETFVKMKESAPTGVGVGVSMGVGVGRLSVGGWGGEVVCWGLEVGAGGWGGGCDGVGEGPLHLPMNCMTNG